MSKKRRHLPQALPPRGPRLEDLLEKARLLQESGDLQGALTVLDEAPPHLQRRLELQVPRAGLLLMLDEPEAARAVLEDAALAYPEEPLVAFLLIETYYQTEELGHAARLVSRWSSRQDALPEEMRANARETFAVIENAVAEVAAVSEVPPATMAQAMYLLEQGQRLMRQGRYAEALRLYRQYAEMVPKWPDGRNAEAMALFFSGDVEKAIRVAEEVLATYGEDAFALTNLVRFHMARDEQEPARRYAERLCSLPLGDDVSRLSLLIEALGMVGDDAALLSIYRQHRSRIAELSPVLLLVLGSAAANMGKPGIARRLWNQAYDQGIPLGLIAPLTSALNRKAPGPTLATRYPTVHIPMLLSPSALEELFRWLEDLAEVDVGDRRRLQPFERFVARTPNVVRVGVQMLWESQPEAGIRLLGMIGNDAAVAELKRFAFGQVGPMPLRMLALETLSDLGKVDPSQPVEMWDEGKQAWGAARLNRLRVVPDDEFPPPAYAEAVRVHLDAGATAISEGRLNEAERELRAALDLDPRTAIAHYNLAVALLRSDRDDEAMAHLRTALEIKPDYVFARCLLASCHIAQEELEAAKEVLSPVHEYNTIRASEWVYYQRILAELALAEEKYEDAEHCLSLALDVSPDDEQLQEQLAWVRDLKWYHSPFWQEMRARTRRREEAKRSQPLARDAGLVECLGRITKESLIATARNMPDPRPYNVRKDVLIHDLADYLAHPACLGALVRTLAEDDVAALRDVLESGGVMPLETFAERYDDDIDESPYWQYHEPETVLGYLRMVGLLSVGTVDGQLSVLIPRELRALLPAALDQWRDVEEEEE